MGLRAKIDSDYKAVLRLYENKEVGNYAVPSSSIASLLREYGSTVSRDVLVFLNALNERTSSRGHGRVGFHLGGQGQFRVTKSSHDSGADGDIANAPTRLPEIVSTGARSGTSSSPGPTPKVLSVIVDCSTDMSMTWDEVKHSVAIEIAVARYHGPVRLSLRLVAGKENWMYKFSKEADRIPDSVKLEEGSSIVDAIGHEIDAVNKFMVQNSSYKDNSEMLIYTVGKDTSSKEYIPVARLGMVIEAAKKRGFKIRMMYGGGKAFAEKLGLELDEKAVREPGSATLLVEKIAKVRK